MSKLKGSILSILFLGMLVFPNISSASTIAELTAMLNSLLAQVVSLQQQITEQTGTTTSWCHTFNTNIKHGNSGEEVKALQTVLTKENFDVSKDKSGYFEEYTASAVVGFQQKYKSEVLTPVGLSYGTGYVGASTRKKLNQLYGCGSQTVPVTTPTNGSCGSSSGQTFSSTPTANLCSAGTSTEVKYGVDGKERYSWICVAPKMSADCYAYKQESTVVNGSCGFLNGANLSAKPTNRLCTTGSATTVTGSGPWYWTCAGSSGGTTESCHANTAEKLSVDLKINGSDSPSSVPYNSVFSVSWSSTIAVDCAATSHYVPLTTGELWTNINDLGVSGTKTLYARHGTVDYLVSPLILGIQCFDSAGNSVSDSVSLPVDPMEGLFEITFPTSGANLIQGETYNITWKGVDPGVTSHSVYLVGGSLTSSESLFLGTTNPTTGLFSWIVPTELKAGSNFQIQLSATDVKASGASSGSFNIIAKDTVAENNQTNQMASVLESARGILEQMLNSLK